ncbi:hypothetical protein MBANPS3_000876 [Mucor bainieri]
MSVQQTQDDCNWFYAAESIKDNQILQRCAMGERALVSFADGSVQSYEQGGPYTIHKATNVLIEQGQSGIHLYNSKEEWTTAKEPLHQLYMSKRAVHHTLPDPTVKNPQLLLYRGASLGLSFAKIYSRRFSNVPVGLVASAHGGTSLNDWKRPDTLNEETEDRTLYGAMMARIKAVGGHIAGILWYQGESDTNSTEDASTYKDRFRLWMDTVRRDVRDPALPIAFVQIGSHAIDVEEMKKNWELVQLAQFDLMMEQGYSAGVASIDCPLDDRLHLSALGLQLVGKRLALAAADLVIAARNGMGLSKDTFCAQYQDPIIPNLKGTIPPCILLATPWPTTLSARNNEVLGFGLRCEDKSVAIIHARARENPNHVEIWISHKPKTELFLTYGLTYPLVDSFHKGWPAFCIKVNP